MTVHETVPEVPNKSVRRCVVLAAPTVETKALVSGQGLSKNSVWICLVLSRTLGHNRQPMCGPLRWPAQLLEGSRIDEEKPDRCRVHLGGLGDSGLRGTGREAYGHAVADNPGGLTNQQSVTHD
jgi:hypothetical protein